MKKKLIDLEKKEAMELNRPLLRTWWISRITGMLVIALVLVVLAEASVIVWLLPLKEVKYSLLTGYSKDTQVIKVEPIEKTTIGWNKLMEIYAKQFVIDLHTIDGQTETLRLKKLTTMVNNDETIHFLESQLNMEDDKSIAKKVFDSGITRSVQIRRLTNLAPDAPNTWQIEWESKESDLGTKIDRANVFISTLTVETSEKTLQSDEEELNPIGFTVIKYTLRMA